MLCLSNRPLSIGARASPLSKVQVIEVLEIMQNKYPEVQFEEHYFSTVGDRDKKTSLRSLDHTDFFTREIDEWVLAGPSRLGIHSAKDLPQPLPEGLEIFYLTKGLDSSDSLVLNPHATLNSLPPQALIATSSVRRENIVKGLRSDLSFCDLRGTIRERLEKLSSGEVDGVVVAEAALIRLELTHLNRITLPGPVAEGQGRLAIVGRQEDEWLKKLCALLET